MKYKNWLIIGAGSIGALKPIDLDSPATEYPLTHAHALYHLRKQNLINDFFIYDVDSEKMIEANERWNCKGDKISNNDVDCLVIACNTDHHYEAIKNNINNNTKLIICEKPFCRNYSQAKKIVKLCREKNINLVVNYSRRFNEYFNSIIKDNYLDNFCSVILKYGRGMKREASHFIDLCNLWFGDFIDGCTFGYGIADFSKKDKTYSAILNYEKCHNVLMCPVNGRDYSIFEIEMFTDKNKIVFKNAGRIIEFYEAEEEKNYGHYYVVGDNPIVTFNTDLEYNLKNMYDSIINTKEILSTGETALKVHEVYKKLGV